MMMMTVIMAYPPLGKGRLPPLAGVPLPCPLALPPWLSLTSPSVADLPPVGRLSSHRRWTLPSCSKCNYKRCLYYILLKTDLWIMQKTVIGLKELASLFHPIRSKTKRIKIQSHTFCHVQRQHHAFVWGFDWFTGLPMYPVNGQFERLLGFPSITKLNWKKAALFHCGFIDRKMLCCASESWRLWFSGDF